MFSTFLWSEVEVVSDGIMSAVVKEESWLGGSQIPQRAF